MAKKRLMNFGFGTNPDAVNLSALPPFDQGQLGGIYERGPCRWQMMQMVDGATVAKDIVYQKSYDLFTVTETIANSSVNEVAGVIMTSVTENYYTLVRKGGVVTVLSKAAETYARGTLVIADSTDKQVIAILVDDGAGLTVTKQQVVGVAQGAINGTDVSVAVSIPYV